MHQLLMGRHVCVKIFMSDVLDDYGEIVSVNLFMPDLLADDGKTYVLTYSCPMY